MTKLLKLQFIKFDKDLNITTISTMSYQYQKLNCQLINYITTLLKYNKCILITMH